MRSYKNKAQDLASLLFTEVSNAVSTGICQNDLLEYTSDKFCNNTNGLFPDICKKIEEFQGV